jgi:Predicted glycosyltransferases
VAFVRERFPKVRVVEQENRGMGGGNNAGMRVSDARYFFLLNSDAWVVGDGLDELVRFAETHADAAVVGPKLLNEDGSLQRSVRGEPTLWRLATEYLYLRKLRAAHRSAQPALRRRLRPHDGAGGGLALGRGAARPARGGRRGGAVRRVVLHVRRGGRLA